MHACCACGGAAARGFWATTRRAAGRGSDDVRREFYIDCTHGAKEPQPVIYTSPLRRSSCPARCRWTTPGARTAKATSARCRACGTSSPCVPHSVSVTHPNCCPRPESTISQCGTAHHRRPCFDFRTYWSTALGSWTRCRRAGKWLTGHVTGHVSAMLTSSSRIV